MPARIKCGHLHHENRNQRKREPASIHLERNWKTRGMCTTFRSFLTDLNCLIFTFRYLRPYKPYDPPTNVTSQIQEFAKSLNISGSAKFKSMPEKFELLNKCFMAFNHIVPNSKVHEIETVG